VSIDDERPPQPTDRDTLPLHTMQHHEHYRAISRVGRLLPFFQRIGDALAGGGSKL
jgi:hypothetical protein